MESIKFIKDYDGNKTGEIKNVKKDIADYLIKKGLCVSNKNDNSASPKDKFIKK